MWEPILLALTLTYRLQIYHFHWLLHWLVDYNSAIQIGIYTGIWTNVWAYVIGSYSGWVAYKSAIPVGVYIDVQPLYRPMQLAVTLGCGLPKPHAHWCLHQCAAIVWTYIVGSCIALWIKNPPILLVFTLESWQCKNQCSWLLH